MYCSQSAPTFHHLCIWLSKYVTLCGVALCCGALPMPCHAVLCVVCALQGAQALYWGATEEGQLLLGSHLDELEGCNPTATMFPPGAAMQDKRSHSGMRS